MENDHNTILQKIDAQEAKIEAIYVSVEKTRKYFLVTMWITIILFVLPLLGMLVAIPMFIRAYLGAFEGLI
jgi:hypothetical protein